MISKSDGADEEEMDVIYGYLCREWNSKIPESRRDLDWLLHFKAFMLHAPIDDPTRVAKRLLRTQTCPAQGTSDGDGASSARYRNRTGGPARGHFW